MDRKYLINSVNNAMELSQDLMERAENRKDLMIGEALFNAFYALELILKEK